MRSDSPESHRCAVPAQVAEGSQPRTHQRPVDQRGGPEGKKESFTHVVVVVKYYSQEIGTIKCQLWLEKKKKKTITLQAAVL